jgi:hypothetical protein
MLKGKMKSKQSQRAMALLRNDKEFRRRVLNEQSDAPMMFVDEIDEVQSFEGLNLPRTGFSFFPEEGNAVDEP